MDTSLQTCNIEQGLVNVKKNICKNTGLKLSALGTGCWSFGGGTYWGDQDQKDVTEAVHASVDLGINYFDTAESYNEGRSEVSLGEAIKGVPRDRILIGTKVSPNNCHRDTLMQHCEASLKRLQTDYIDIYMIHWPIHPRSMRHFTHDPGIIENPPTIDEAMDALRELKRQGKIRYIGVSNFSKRRLLELKLEEISTNELPYNLLCRAIEYDTLPLCAEEGVGILGYMPLLQGILADSFPTLDDVPAWRRRTRHFNSERTKETRHGEKGFEAETNEALQEIRRISREAGLTMQQLALKWILHNSAITCILAGARNVSQLEANVEATNGLLEDDIKKELDQVTRPLMEKLGNHFDYYESAENDRTI